MRGLSPVNAACSFNFKETIVCLLSKFGVKIVEAENDKPLPFT